ncbi:hypothetical protein [Pseudooceanicola sp.]|uniref:hypothetical protein n=1 Tax=Pseudooceanicola sp. TaxID=1914328 RepID=UPI00351274B4
MSMLYVILDPAGCVARAGRVRQGQALPEGALEVVLTGAVAFVLGAAQIGAQWPLRVGELGGMMQVAGYLVPRPASPQPLVSSNSIVVPSCPAGTRIEVFDHSGGERMYLETDAGDGYSETFEFPDPGLYEVEVEAPAPYLPTSVRLEVTS